jgi:hypothetical protein
MTQLHQHVAHLRPVPAARHASPIAFVHRDLHKYICIFVRAQCTRFWNPLTAAPTRSCHGEKTLQLIVCGRPVTISTNRIKSAYILNGTDRGNTTFNPAIDATPAVAPPATPPSPSAQTALSGRHIHFPARFNISGNISARVGGGGLCEPTTMLANHRRPQQRQLPLSQAPLAAANKDAYLRHAILSVRAALTSR